MENPVVGYRFRPTDVELVDDYLRPKNLEEDTSDVDRVISTVNICSFDPWELPSQSTIQSKDQVLYFFGRIEKKYKSGGQQIRRTKSGSGFWKITGKSMAIMRKSGKLRHQIGEKKVLVFHFNKSKTNWVMHEYHLSPLDLSMAYTICKVKFKGSESDMYSPPGDEISHSSITDMNNSGGLSSGSEVGQSQNLAGVEGFSLQSLQSEELQNPRLFGGFLHLEEEAQLEEVMRKAFDNLSDDDFNYLLNDDDQSKIVSMQQDYSHYRPKKPVTGVMVGYTSDDNDSDSVSGATSSVQTLSPCDSFGSSSHRIELQESPNSTIKLVPITQEVSQAPGQVTETGEHKLCQETVKKKRARSFYRMIHRLFKKINLCSSIPRT